MKISTLSVMVGSSACNLRCKYCISRATYNIAEKEKLFVPSESLIAKAARVFDAGGGFTALITGKGEPTLVPHQKLVNLIRILYKYTPVVELQTNGILLTDKKVKDYAKAGLSTIAISCASNDDKFNHQVMNEGMGKPWSLKDIASLVVKNNLILRFAAVATHGGIYNIRSFLDFIGWQKALVPQNYPSQLTIRRMGLPGQHRLKTPRGKKVAKFVRANQIDTTPIWRYLKKHGQKIITFPWGSEVYDYQGIAVCIADCLTIRPEEDTIRSAILYPDGHLRYSWEFPAAVIF
jgi:uncharacterized Fe-S cluster-containing radical SAM superfamily enzyme